MSLSAVWLVPGYRLRRTKQVQTNRGLLSVNSRSPSLSSETTFVCMNSEDGDSPVSSRLLLTEQHIQKELIIAKHDVIMPFIFWNCLGIDNDL